MPRINTTVTNNQLKNVSSSTVPLTPPPPSSSSLSLVQNIIKHENAEKVNDTDILPSYYNKNVINAKKYADLQQKKKLLWGSKKEEEQAKWVNTKFSQDEDGTKASKFMRLMGIKDGKSETKNANESIEGSSSKVNKTDDLLKSMEQQYEVARHVTHLSRGCGLGFHVDK